jgi:hypothetical protein
MQIILPFTSAWWRYYFLCLYPIGESWMKGPSTLMEIWMFHVLTNSSFVFIFWGNIVNWTIKMCMLLLRGRWHIEQLWGNAGIDARPSTNANEQTRANSDTCTASHRGKPLLFSLVYYFHWLRSQQPNVHIFLLHAYLLRCCLLSVGKITEPNCLHPWLKYKFAYHYWIRF